MAENEGLRVTDNAIVVSILPDVCFTPPMMLPIPYIIFAKLSDGLRFTDTVRMTKQNVMTTDSRLPTVYGDEPGIGGGILSGVNKGWCRPITYSKNVRAKSKNVTFNSSLYWMNCNGPDGMWNTIGIAIYIQPVCSVRVGNGGEILGDTNPPPVSDKESIKGHIEMQTESPFSTEPMFPAVSYDLDMLPPIELPPTVTPSVIILNKLQFGGNMSMQREGSLNPLTFSKEGYEAEASSTLRQFTNSFGVASDYAGHNVELYSKITGPLGGAKVGFIPGPTPKFIYTYSSKKIETTTNGWKVSGELNMDLETTVIPRPPPPPVPVPIVEPSPVRSPLDEFWDGVKDVGKKIGGGLAVGAGTVIVAVTVADDFLGQLEDDPLIPVGLKIIQSGWQLMN